MEKITYETPVIDMEQISSDDVIMVSVASYPSGELTKIDWASFN